MKTLVKHSNAHELNQLSERGFRIVYTDGSCLTNPGGNGGWGWVTTDGEEGSGGEVGTTNNRMELMAFIQAMQSTDGPLCIVSDSMYSLHVAASLWKARKNLDLVAVVRGLASGRMIEWRWVKGHAGNVHNERADQLAGNAANAIRTDGEGSRVDRMQEDSEAHLACI